jgi:hypothetical protein
LLIKEGLRSTDHLRDSDEAGRDGRLEDAQEESGRDQTCEVTKVVTGLVKVK